MIKAIDKIRFQIKNRTLFRYVLYRIKAKKINSKYFGIDRDNQIGKFIFNYRFNVMNKSTFNECLCYLKYYYKNDLWEQCADKLGSKDFLKKIGLSKYLPRVYGIYENTDSIDLDKLPTKFVLKTNHDCGTVFVCDKNITDFNSVFTSINKSMRKKYSSHSSEWVYENIKPMIFAEEFLEPSSQYNELIDFKFQTIGGNYVFGYALSNKTKSECYTLFEGDYIVQNTFYQSVMPRKLKSVTRPKDFGEMVNIASCIAKHFLEVRVDMYSTSKGIKIGELTFFTQSGHGVFTNYKYDLKYGVLLKQAIDKEKKHS